MECLMTDKEGCSGGGVREWTSSVASMKAQSDENRPGCIAGSLSCILFALLFLNVLFVLFCVCITVCSMTVNHLMPAACEARRGLLIPWN